MHIYVYNAYLIWISSKALKLNNVINLIEITRKGTTTTLVQSLPAKVLHLAGGSPAGTFRQLGTDLVCAHLGYQLVIVGTECHTILHDRPNFKK